MKLHYKKPQEIESDTPIYAERNPCFKIVMNKETWNYYESLD
jgi:hypothetical protein